VEELVWRLEEAANRVEEWAFWTSLSLGESVENLLDQVSQIPQALGDYFQDVGFHLENLALSAEMALENLSARLERWWEEGKAHLEETLQRVGAWMRDMGAWLSENADKVALGVGVAGVSLGVAGLGAERIGEDVREFYQGATVVVQVELKERFAAFLEEVRGLDDLAKQIASDIAQGKLPFSSQGGASYGERADPRAGPEPW
jgi:hypothetical protein